MDLTKTDIPDIDVSDDEPNLIFHIIEVDIENFSNSFQPSFPI